MVQQAPANTGWQQELAQALRYVGDVERARDNFKALDHYQESQTILRRLVELSPDNAGWKNDLAAVTSRLNNLKASEQQQHE